MNIILNGEARRSEAATLTELWREETGLAEGDPRKGFAIAVNGQLVPHAEWDTTRLGEDDRIEIVRAMQGG